MACTDTVKIVNGEGGTMKNSKICFNDSLVRRKSQR